MEFRLNKYMASATCLLLLMSARVSAQQDSSKVNIDKKAMMKDSLDGKLDFSRFIIEGKGFLPVPIIITDRAVGGFGGMLALLFMKPKIVEGHNGYIPPDINAFMGGYTVNGTWMLGAFRSASFPKIGIKYKVFVGYANLNLDFYRDIPEHGEQKFPFKIKPIPLSFTLSKRIIKGREIYAGLSYGYMPTKVAARFDGALPAFIQPLDLNNSTAALGIFLNEDTRNSIFTPDKGTRSQIKYDINANWTGSDYDFQKLNATFTWFTPLRSNWISGLKAEFQHAFSEPPFYLVPSIDMRGIPAARYQGVTTGLVETEQRFDLDLRWSVVGFGGVGKAIQSDETFSQGRTVYSIGTGFRYLLARAFKLRAGVDIAKGTDSWGYYIVFGHNWNR